MQNTAVIFGCLFKSEDMDPLTGPLMLEARVPQMPRQDTGSTYAVKAPVAFIAHGETALAKYIPVHCHYSERNGQEWYAFSCLKEKALFLRMLTCDGVGPAKALNVIARTNWEELVGLIASGDRERFVKLPGIGPKTGEAMLRVLFAGAPVKATTPAQPVAIPLNMDCVMALTALGFKRPDAEARTRKAQEAMKDTNDAELLLPLALKSK